jgi:hypothetical protein
MLLYFRELKSRDDAINDGDIIFAINDPSVIECHHLPKSTKRKPDLVCLLAKKFKSLFHKGSRRGFKACMKTAAKVKGDDKELEPQEDSKTTWGDILQSWELEAKREIKSEIRTNFKVKEFLSGDEAEILSSDMDVRRVASTFQGESVFVSWTLT